MLLCSVIIIFKLFYYSAFPQKNHPQIQLFAHLFLSIFSPENAKTHMRGHIEMHPRIWAVFVKQLNLCTKLFVQRFNFGIAAKRRKGCSILYGTE